MQMNRVCHGSSALAAASLASRGLLDRSIGSRRTSECPLKCQTGLYSRRRVDMASMKVNVITFLRTARNTPG